MFNRPIQTTTVPATEDVFSGAERHRFDEIAARDASELEELRARHDRMLEALNADIARIIPDGAVIAAPVCQTACTPGPIAEFFLMLRLDPFGPENMRFAPANLQTAEALDAVPYSAEVANLFDKEMTNFCNRAMAAWEDFKVISPDANTIDVLNHRDTLRALIAQAAERLCERAEEEAPNLSEANILKRTKIAA